MASSQTHISVREHQAVLVITVLDEQLTQEQQVSEWRDEMADALRSSSASGVVLNMANVEYLTSVAVFPIIATRSLAEEMGSSLVLCQPSDTVAKVLTVAQLIVEGREHVKHLVIADDLDHAFKLLAS